MTIRELMEEQRKRVRSGNPAERFAAVLLIPAELSRRLRLLTDSQMGRLLDDEVYANMCLLAPEAPICIEAAQRLQQLPRTNREEAPRWSGSSRQNQGEHILHAEAVLCRAGIPHLLLPFQAGQVRKQRFHGSLLARRPARTESGGISPQ
jgi:hypothetical protein